MRRAGAEYCRSGVCAGVEYRSLRRCRVVSIITYHGIMVPARAHAPGIFGYLSILGIVYWVTQVSIFSVVELFIKWYSSH